MVNRVVSDVRQPEPTWRILARVVLKAALLFLGLNLCFALTMPLNALGRLSTYNVLFPGRDRLPYGDQRSAEYNLSLNNIPAMIASHKVAQPAGQDEFRVLVIGDSSVWGWLLPSEETLAAQLTARAAANGQNIQFYNLGYPVLSATKDLMLLEAALASDPDLIVWPVTLASLAPASQLDHPLLQNNAVRVRSLIDRYDLALDPDDPQLVEPGFWENTIAGRRRDLADLIRLQLLAPLWAATGIDQLWPETISLRQSDFEADVSWEGHPEPATLTARDLNVDVLGAGVALAGEVPVLIVNEPIYVSDGANSHLRYNSFYPRWAYDQYRDLLATAARAGGWHYVDLWNSISPGQFTDTPVHLTEAGTGQLADQIWDALEASNLLQE
jgi:hypothetical protein